MRRLPWEEQCQAIPKLPLCLHAYYLWLFKHEQSSHPNVSSVLIFLVHLRRDPSLVEAGCRDWSDGLLLRLGFSYYYCSDSSRLDEGPYLQSTAVSYTAPVRYTSHRLDFYVIQRDAPKLSLGATIFLTTFVTRSRRATFSLTSAKLDRCLESQSCAFTAHIACTSSPYLHLSASRKRMVCSSEPVIADS